MDYTSINKKVTDYIRENISEKRQKHIFSVCQEAVKLAELYGGDVKKCETAALFHDIAKELSIEEMDNMVIEYGLHKKYLGQPNLAHGKLGAILANEKWGIEDPDILNAISFHTTGRPDMTITEKIVFIADAIEPLREYSGVEEIRKATYNDLDKGCYTSLKETIDHLKAKGVSYIDEDTAMAKQWLERKMNMNNKEFALLAAKALDAKKGEDITIFDIALKSSIADYMILASGSNERLIGALADEVEDEFAKEGLLVKSVEGKKDSGWILLDFGDIIVNVLTLEMREKYNIEKVWADCETLNWEE